MKTAKGTECDGNHQTMGGEYAPEAFEVKLINDRRVTVCQHRVGRSGYCGVLIDVTGHEVVICCGEGANHAGDIVNPLG